ncbi:MAG: sigma-70 family RNA polymerase sigma factor [Bryobacteraceae bacterium]
MHFQAFDAEYVQRLTDGDSVTEEHFASYFGELLFLKLRSRLRSRQLIEDIRQETLLRVLQILRKKNGVEHPERFGAFVNSVGNNVMMEYCRFESRHDPMDDHQAEPVDSAVNLDGPLIHSDVQRIVRRVMDELSEKDRILLREVYLEELDKAEICRKHKVDSDYLRVLLHRAKSRFRKIYIDQSGGPSFSPGLA